MVTSSAGTSASRTPNAFPRVALFTITMNRLEYTLRMLESLEGSTEVPFDHYVVDNGSVDGTQEFLSENQDRFAGVLLNETNTGLANGWNAALDLVSDAYDYVVKVDNDCEFLDRGWLEALIEVSEAKDRRIVLSPRVEGLGPDLDGGHPRHEFTTISGRTVGLSNHVGGICLFAPTQAYAGWRFGKAPLHGNQDVRFSLHVRLELGYEMGYVEEVHVNHMDGTFGQVDRYPEYWRERAEQKWRVHGEHPTKTALMRPARRIALLWRMDRGGLIEEGLPAYLFGRLKHRYNVLTGRPTQDRHEVRQGTAPD